MKNEKIFQESQGMLLCCNIPFIIIINDLLKGDDYAKRDIKTGERRLSKFDV